MRWAQQKRCDELEPETGAQCELRDDHTGPHKVDRREGHGNPWEHDQCPHFGGPYDRRCQLIRGHDEPHDCLPDDPAELRKLMNVFVVQRETACPYAGTNAVLVAICSTLEKACAGHGANLFPRWSDPGQAACWGVPRGGKDTGEEHITITRWEVDSDDSP